MVIEKFMKLQKKTDWPQEFGNLGPFRVNYDCFSAQRTEWDFNTYSIYEYWFFYVIIFHEYADNNTIYHIQEQSS